MMKHPPAQVLNLKRDSLRWDKWVNEADRIGLKDYRRFEAIDGATLVNTRQISNLFQDNDFSYHRGVMACALSHMDMWLYQIENQVPAMLIFEDDARFNQPFKLPELPENWDLFYLGGLPDPVQTQAFGFTLNENILRPDKRNDFTTLAYMLSYQGAQKLLLKVHQEGFKRAVDFFMIDAYDQLNVFCFREPIVYNDPDLKSSIR